GCRWANLFLDRRHEGRPFHVGVLLDNVPEYLFALGGAALAGATVVGLNHTRQDEHLLRDVEHTDVGLLITEPRHRPLLDPIADRLPCPLLVVGEPLDDALSPVVSDDPGLEPAASTTWALICIPGTPEAP